MGKIIETVVTPAAGINQYLRETVFKERNLEGRLQRIEEQLGIN